MIPNRWQLCNQMILAMVNKTMECHVILGFPKATTNTITFNQLNGCHEANFTHLLWWSITSTRVAPCHIITGIFEVQKIIKTNMVLQLKDLLFHLNLCDKVIAYVKDKGTNLNILTNSLTIIVSCVPLMLPQPYDICWQMLSKCY
jgi:hypothetical protein